jgi:predicted dehydrogenase
MAETIRWGILSTGLIAGKFAEDLRLLPDAALVAVGSRTAAAAESFAQVYGLPHAHGSWQALAEDPDVDVIYVATPHPAHAEATLVCLDAGKAVLCEKPFAMDLPQAEKVVEAARAKQLFLMEAMWTRCFPAVRRIAALVADGAIGTVTAIHADFGLGGELAPTHRLRARELGGGALLDLGIYPVTFAHLFLGRPAHVAAWARLSPEGVDENTGILLGHDSGAVAALTCSIVGDSARRAVVTGTDGRIEVARQFHCPASFTVWHGEDAEEHDMPYEGWGYHFEAAEVHRCLRAGALESEVVPLSETMTIMSTLDLVRGKIGVSYD